MDKVSDELLMAFADDELDDVARRELDALVSSDPEVAKRLAVFTSTGRNLSSLFDEAMSAPVPGHLLEIAERFPVELGLRDADKGNARRFRSFGGGADYWRYAVAASLALVVGTGIGWHIQNTSHSNGQTGSSAIVADGPFADALEHEPSGSSRLIDRTVDGARSLKPLLTFASRDGGYCREYQLLEASGKTFSGVACRSAHMNWQIKVHVPVGAAVADNSKIVPASGPQTETVDAVVDELMVGDAMSLESEALLIEMGWKQQLTQD